MFTQARLIAAGGILLVLLVSFGGMYWWGNSWRTQYQTLNSLQLADKLATQTARADALAKQITDRDTVLKNNAEVMSDLSKKHAADVANLGSTSELVNRLLHDAAHVTLPDSRAMPETNSGSVVNATADNGGDGQLGGLLVRAAAEYREHVRVCTALQTQIAPQLPQ